VGVDSHRSGRVRGRGRGLVRRRGRRLLSSDKGTIRSGPIAFQVRPGKGDKRRTSVGLALG
jgi:hypothetical protein